MKDVKVNIGAQSFPSQLASDAEKATDEFGLKVGQAIQYEWFKKDGGGSRFYNQWDEFHKLRLYARGEQPTQKYKQEMAVDGDLSYLNLDWTPVPIIPKFIDIVVNGMSDRVLQPKAYAQDAMSQDKRTAYQDMIEGQMAAKDVLLTVEQNTGESPFSMPVDELPANDEEMSLYMQLNYKPAIEIAEETAIHTVFAENKYDDVRKRMDYDMATVGIAVAKHDFLQGSGVEINYVDPATCVYSYTEDPNFQDCYYWGEVKTTPLSELFKIDPSISKSQLEKISESGQLWHEHHGTSSNFQSDVFSRDSVSLMHFNYKTTKKFVYKKKNLENGGSRIIEKDENFNPPTEMMVEGKFERIEKTIDVWYSGIMVLGTNIILKWQLEENMVRPKSSSQHAIPNFVACAPRMYKGRIESLLRRMIPFADQIQITHLKLQQVINRVVPDGVYIDADGLNEVDLGNGAAYSPQEALRLYFQTGSVIGRSQTQDGEFNHGKTPIQQLSSSSGASKSQMLISNYNHYLGMIRSVTGLNEAVDGSSPDSNALVGVQKLAAMNSNTATRHILDGSLFIYKSLAEAISYRISDILEYADFADDFANKIGKYNVSILRDMNDLYIYDFGIFIEIAPDEEQKAQLESNIQMALSNGGINLEDAIDIREIKNIKLGNQLLKVKRKAKEDKEQQIAMQQQAMKSQADQALKQMEAESVMQKANAEAQAKLQVVQMEAQLKASHVQVEVEAKMALMEKEFDYQMQLAKIAADGQASRETQREDGKKKRISQQSTEQSKLIDQRKNNLPPTSFESNEDSLDGFDLAEFSPR